MLIDLGAFLFVLLGSKVLLGVVVIYLMLPGDAVCAICDSELLPVEHPRGARRLLRLCRLQRFWCMECCRESLARPRLRPRPGSAPVRQPRPVPQPGLR